MKRFPIAIAAVVLVVVAMIVKLAFFTPANSGVALETSLDAPFELIDQDGHPFTSGMLAHKPHVLFFGYTSCPDICPTTLASISRWIDEAKLSRVQFVFITVDPERDTPAVLKQYLSAFSPRIIGLTGSPDDVSAVLDAYHIFRRRVPQSGGSYALDHTATIFLVDDFGKLQGTIARDESDARALAKLRRLEGASG